MTGALLSLCMLRQACFPSFMCLREVNPYVAAALRDWTDAANTLLVPRECAAMSRTVEFAGNVFSNVVLESFSNQGSSAEQLIAVDSQTYNDFIWLLPPVVMSRKGWHRAPSTPNKPKRNSPTNPADGTFNSFSEDLRTNEFKIT